MKWVGVLRLILTFLINLVPFTRRSPASESLQDDSPAPAGKRRVTAVKRKVG